TKCDLCRDYAAPACVQSCPTEAIIRLEPERDFAEVAAMLDLADPQTGARRRRIPWGSLAVAGCASLGVAIVFAALRAGSSLSPASGVGYAAGILAALAMLGLLAH